jgi:peptidyl-prolyl cis-trans isomerase SurA
MRRNIVVLRTSVKWAVAIAAAGVTLSACGTVQMGAAAIVGNQRISSSTLTAQAANLSAAYQADKKKTQISYPASEIPQQALSWLLRFRVRDALAKREGISVTPSQQQQALAALNAQVKQGGFASLAVAGVSSGLPPDLIGDLASYQAIGNLLAAKFDGGKAPKSTAAQSALNARLIRAQCLASKSLGIKVNPQFGVFDYNQIAVVAAPSTLSAAQPSASPSPTPKPQLTPPC